MSKQVIIREEVEKANFLDGQGKLIKKWGPGLDDETDVTDDRNVMSFFVNRWLPRLEKMKTAKEVDDQVKNFRDQVPSLAGTKEERKMIPIITTVLNKIKTSSAQESKTTSKSNDAPGGAAMIAPGRAMMVVAPVATIQPVSSRQGTLSSIDPGFIHAKTQKTYDQLYKKHRELTLQLRTAVSGGHGLKAIHNDLIKTHDALRKIEQRYRVAPKDRQFAKDTGLFQNKRYFRYLDSKDDQYKRFPSYTGGKFKGHHFDLLAGGKRRTRKRRRRRKRKTKKHRKKKRTRRRKPKKRHRRTRRR